MESPATGKNDGIWSELRHSRVLWRNQGDRVSARHVIDALPLLQKSKSNPRKRPEIKPSCRARSLKGDRHRDACHLYQYGL